MVICLWDSVDQATAAALTGEVVVSWIFWVYYRIVKSDKEMLGEIVLVGGV